MTGIDPGALEDAFQLRGKALGVRVDRSVHTELARVVDDQVRERFRSLCYRHWGLLRPLRLPHNVEGEPAQQILQGDPRVVLRSVLELFQVVQSRPLVDPVRGRDDARGLVRPRVDALLDRCGGTVADVAGLPLEPLALVW